MSSQEIAAGIRGARFVGLASRDHILLGDEPAFAKAAEEIRAFLAQDGWRVGRLGR